MDFTKLFICEFDGKSPVLFFVHLKYLFWFMRAMHASEIQPHYFISPYGLSMAGSIMAARIQFVESVWRTLCV